VHLYLKTFALVALCMSAGTRAATSWQDLKVGAGGYVRGLAVAPDGTMVGRTDTNGAYLWNGSSWVQLVNSSSMPAAIIATNPVQLGEGVYDFQIAASDSSIMYMAFDGYVFRSTNKGTTWTQTAFIQDTAGTNPNDNNGYAQVGQKMAVDPNNSNIVYFGTENQGLYVTTNGGARWSVVSVPTGTNAGISGILFYAGGGAVGGVTQVLYVCSNGSGVYVTTNGGTTWTRTPGGPTTVTYAAIDTSGNYYAASGTTLWKYNGRAWAELFDDSPNTIEAVAINPFNQSEVAAATSSGWINLSYNAGASWTGANYKTNLVSTDIPWLAGGNSTNGTPSPGAFYLTTGGLAFSPVTNGQLILSAGTGVWSMSVPSSGVTSATPLTWTDMSVGIENLVANAIVVPPGGVPVLASWDRPFFQVTNPNAYGSKYGPVDSSTIQMGWSLDYASTNPSFIVGLSDWNNEQTGYSTNGGASWTVFASTPASGLRGGTISASTPQNIVWAPAGGTRPYYTLNQGATWTGITLPGVSSWSGFDWAYYLDQRSVTADRVNANTFYLYFAGHGVFQTSNGGVAWTNVYSGNNGYIESNGSYAGFNSTLSSVPGNAGQLFYTSGPQNGSTATSPVNNPLYRSTNGGATWTAVANVLAVSCFGFGAAAPGQSYPAIYIVGYVNNVFGIWQSVNNAATWTNIGTYPIGGLDWIDTISGDPNSYGAVYVGFHGGGYAYLPAAGSAQPIPMPPTNVAVH
jgi:hypothetical protein